MANFAVCFTTDHARELDVVMYVKYEELGHLMGDMPIVCDSVVNANQKMLFARLEADKA